MSEMQNNRRHQAQKELGLDNTEEELQIEQSSSYRTVQSIAKWMDKFCLDPIIGFFMPGFGDALTSVFAVPFIYVAACKVRSLPLTLAVIFNILRDVALGLIPFYIGDIIDFCNRAYLQNCKLIVGFVEDDQEVINEVNRKAVWTGIMIILFCVIIYYLVKLVVYVGSVISDFFNGLFAAF